MTATLQREQYSSFLAFSSSDSRGTDASWDREEVTGAGAGRAEGGLEGGGSLPALLDEGEGEDRWGAAVFR